jgi:hypothetical protein
MLARVDHAPYSDSVTHPESGDRTTDLSYPPYYLVARNYRVVRIASVITSNVQIGVADAAVKHLEHHVVGPRLATFDLKRC